MSNLKQLRGRLKTIESTQKITKAMQMVSASKLKRAKDVLSQVSELRALSLGMTKDVIKTANAEGMQDALLELMQHDADCETKSGEQFLILFTSDRGLCGSYNSTLLRSLKKYMADAPDTKLIVFGRKGSEHCKKYYANNVVKHYLIASAPDHLGEISDFLVQNAISGSLVKLTAFFSYFKNAITQEVTNEQVIPMNFNDEAISDEESQQVVGFELEGEELLAAVLDVYIRNAVGYFYAQARASEEGARTTAMDNATRNAGEMMDNLRLKLNRTRQSIITTELIEIISGAEAV